MPWVFSVGSPSRFSRSLTLGASSQILGALATARQKEQFRTGTRFCWEVRRFANSVIIASRKQDEPKNVDRPAEDSSLSVVAEEVAGSKRTHTNTPSEHREDSFIAASRRRIGVFWDFENVRPQNGGTAKYEDFANALRESLGEHGQLSEMHCYFKPVHIPSPTKRKALEQAGFALRPCEPNKSTTSTETATEKNLVDRHIQADIERFVRTHKKTKTGVCVISDDGGFAGSLRDCKEISHDKCKTIVIGSRNVSPALEKSAELSFLLGNSLLPHPRRTTSKEPDQLMPVIIRNDNKNASPPNNSKNSSTVETSVRMNIPTKVAKTIKGVHYLTSTTPSNNLDLQATMKAGKASSTSATVQEIRSRGRAQKIVFKDSAKSGQDRLQETRDAHLLGALLAILRGVREETTASRNQSLSISRKKLKKIWRNELLRVIEVATEMGLIEETVENSEQKTTLISLSEVAEMKYSHF